MPVIFFNAQEIFQPMPFMLEEQEQFEMIYDSETEWKCLPESCSSKYGIILAARK
jgi:hypothetical protein